MDKPGLEIDCMARALFEWDTRKIEQRLGVTRSPWEQQLSGPQWLWQGEARALWNRYVELGGPVLPSIPVKTPPVVELLSQLFGEGSAHPIGMSLLHAVGLPPNATIQQALDEVTRLRKLAYPHRVCNFCHGKKVNTAVDAIEADGRLVNPRPAPCVACHGQGWLLAEEAPDAPPVPDPAPEAPVGHPEVAKLPEGPTEAVKGLPAAGTVLPGQDKQLRTVPRVGLGATIQHHSDRTACTIIEISRSRHRITLVEDRAERTDRNGMSEDQSYQYHFDPSGKRYTATRRRDGNYRITQVHGRGGSIDFGVRQAYRDPGF